MGITESRQIATTQDINEISTFVTNSELGKIRQYLRIEGRIPTIPELENLLERPQNFDYLTASPQPVTWKGRNITKEQFSRIFANNGTLQLARRNGNLRSNGSNWMDVISEQVNRGNRNGVRKPTNVFIIQYD